MKVKYKHHEYDRENDCFIVHEEIRDEPDDKRHKEICYVCGNKTYPECRKLCPHGKESQE